MNLVVMTIPDDPALLVGWLEQQLTGLHLGQLVRELSVLHGAPATPTSSVRDLVGDRLDRVLRHGLWVLPAAHLQQLLRQPDLLLELQEIVLSSGSPHWDRLTTTGELVPLVEQGWQQLRQTLPLDPVPVRRPSWQTWFSAGAIAATLLVFSCLVYPLFRPILSPSAERGGRAIAWGWARPGALPTDLGRAEYLRLLADEAHEWFNEQPEEAPALARRIEEMEQGCRTLLAAKHPPLSPEDRVWLAERCQQWLKEFEDAHARLQAGADPGKVRQEVKGTVNRLEDALRKRADLRT